MKQILAAAALLGTLCLAACNSSDAKPEMTEAAIVSLLK